MKRISIIIICFATLFLEACKKNALIEEPKDFISSSNFYKTADNAESAVLGIYSIASATPFRYQLLELHSDIATGRGSWSSLNIFNQVLDQTQIGRVRDYLWNPIYSMISRSNDVLSKVPPINMDETKKKNLLAEARFLRSLGYFDLVRGFGPVPIRTEPIENLSQISAPRAPIQEVYNLIIEDLKIAENDLPNSVGANTRRASKWAAKMLMAQVYLTQEKWVEAATKAEEVINSGQFQLVQITQAVDFYKIFAVNTSVEDIMSIHFSAIQQDDYPLTLHQPNIPVYNNSSTGFFTTLPVTKTIIGAAWDNNDLRKSFNLYTEYKNASGVITQLPSLTPILFKKFIATTNGIRSNSRPLLRYAEAFLIYAEAKTMNDGIPSALALERLNMIKRRGYGKDLNTPSTIDYPAGMTKDQFRDAVIKERAYEFINEQRRWWDLKRIGKAKEFIDAATGISFNNFRLLFPIPQEEINNNPMLSQSDQNPGY